MGQLGVQSTRLITVAILARLLQPEDYGTAAIAVTLASFASTLGDMGMGSALVQTQHAPPKVRSTVFFASLAFGIGGAALFIGLAQPIGIYLDDPRIGAMVSVGALTFVIYSVGSTSQAMYMRAMNFRTLELRYMFALVFAAIVAIVAAAAGLGAWALVLQQIVLMAIFVAALWWHNDWYPSLEFSIPDFRRLGAFAIRIAGGRYARLGELIVLALLIGKLVSVADLGVWTFAMGTVILPLTLIAIPLVEVFFSAFSRMRGERERISALWIQGIGILAAVIFPLLTGFVIVADDLVPLVFGSQWRVAVPVMQVLSIYVVVRCLQSWNSIILDAAGKPQITLWTQLAAFCLAPVSVVIGSRWGIEAVAVCFVVSQLIAVEIPSFIAVLSELGLRSSRIAARLAPVLAATLVMAVACVACRLLLSSVGAGPVAQLVTTVAVGAVVYSVALSVLAPDLRRQATVVIRRAFGRVRAAADRGVEA